VSPDLDVADLCLRERAALAERRAGDPGDADTRTTYSPICAWLATTTGYYQKGRLFFYTQPGCCKIIPLCFFQLEISEALSNALVKYLEET
jgi:hypothetical protein